MPKLPKKPKLLPPVSEPFDPGEQEAAEIANLSVAALRLYFAAGAIPPDCAGIGYEYLEAVPTMIEVARAFDVSERTVHTWRSKGMPGQPGSYPLPAIRRWRLAQDSAPAAWLYRGNKELPPTTATGDLARAILRVLRVDLRRAVSRARKDIAASLELIDRNDDAALDNLVLVIMAKHLDGFCLDDEAIERLLAETWDLA